MSRDFPTFSRTCIFFLLTLSLPWSSLFFSSLLSASSLLCFSSVHTVGILTSKLPSATVKRVSQSGSRSSFVASLTHGLHAWINCVISISIAWQSRARSQTTDGQMTCSCHLWNVWVPIASKPGENSHVSKVFAFVFLRVSFPPGYVWTGTQLISIAQVLEEGPVQFFSPFSNKTGTCTCRLHVFNFWTVVVSFAMPVSPMFRYVSLRLQPSAILALGAWIVHHREHAISFIYFVLYVGPSETILSYSIIDKLDKEAEAVASWFLRVCKGKQ